jgi:acetyl-CoA synthetase
MKDVIFRPSKEMMDNSRISAFMREHDIPSYEELIKRASRDDEWFWDEVTKHLDIEWFEPYHTVKDSSRGIPWTQWYVGGKLNIVHNVLDRHALGEDSGNLAVVWEGEDGDTRMLTFMELHEQVTKCASGMAQLGIGKGDTVGIYMPMVPETVVQLLACMKIGAICIPIFSGYAPPAVAQRLQNAGAKLLFTADGSSRRGKPISIKPNADEAVAASPAVEYTVVVKRAGNDIPFDVERDVWWDDLLMMGKKAHTEMMDSEDVALIIYTSGTTGMPKGTVHTHAGTLVQVAKEVGYFFDVKKTDLFFWLSDIGWMMGPWMIIGSLHHGCPIFIYEGAPNYPGPDRLWEMIERHGVTIFGISPTAIRMLMGFPEQEVTKHDLSSLRILGSTGEPWDPDSWTWFFEKVGGSRCPIINISGGTDIIGCFLAPLPINVLKPTTLRGPGVGMSLDVWDEDGNSLMGTGEVGYLVATKPTPSMTRGLWGDPERYMEAYWNRWPDVWNHGDWAHVDEDGFWYLKGRADDTIKVAGRRIGPSEIESALIDHEAVREAAAIGVPHDIKGEGILAFVVLGPGFEESEELRTALRNQVGEILGKVDRPEDVRFVSDLPKTRSAKIVRRVIKKRYLGETELGDLSSIENPDAIEEIARSR